MRGSALAKSSQRTLETLKIERKVYDGNWDGKEWQRNPESKVMPQGNAENTVGKEREGGKAPKFFDKDCQESWNFP